MYVNEIMLAGMARLNKVVMEKNGTEYTLYQNERERIHENPFFSGDKEKTYWKLVQIDKNKR